MAINAAGLEIVKQAGYDVFRDGAARDRAGLLARSARRRR